MTEEKGSERQKTLTYTNCTVQVHSETNIMGVRCIGHEGYVPLDASLRMYSAGNRTCESQEPNICAF